MKNLPSETPRAGDGHCHELYVGLDVHKDSISVAYATPGQQPPVFLTRIDNTPTAVARLARKVSARGAALWCYEAGPCGHVLRRQLQRLGQECLSVRTALGLSNQVPRSAPAGADRGRRQDRGVLGRKGPYASKVTAVFSITS